MIETARLLLRPMELADLDALLHVFGDPQVMASFGEAPLGREQMESWVQRNLAHQTRYGHGLFSVITRADGLLIGDCGLEHMDLEGVQVAELGYDIRRDHWNQGFATEAAMAVRDYAFNVLELPMLVSLIRVGNEASRRVAEKVGLKCVGELTRRGRRYWHYTLERPSTDRR